VVRHPVGAKDFSFFFFWDLPRVLFSKYWGSFSMDKGSVSVKLTIPSLAEDDNQ
jgi:hypothetical protein